MRKSVGCGLHANAPRKIHDSNIFLATYRLDQKNQSIVSLARNNLFPFCGSLLASSRQAPRWCLCFKTSDDGLISAQPIQRDVDAPAADEEPELEYRVYTDVDDKVEASAIDGVSLKFDPECPEAGAIAIKHLPAINERLFYLSSIGNVDRAIKGRIVDPEVPVTLTKEDRADMTAVVDRFLAHMDSDKRCFMTIATSMLFGDLKSKKWTEQRALNGLERLRMIYNPRYRFKGAIKLEPSKHGKPPRFLCADGDEGQIMAWLMIGVLEKWVVKRYCNRTIKGANRGAAIDRVINHLKHEVKTNKTSSLRACDILENDGTAWDACMSLELREMIENRVMDKVAGFLSGYVSCDIPHTFTEARQASNRLKTLKVTVACKGYLYGHRGEKEEDDPIPQKVGWKRAFRSIRRSGCRGTSILNWIANMCCWSFVIGGADGAKLVIPNGCKLLCRDGVVRVVHMAFEGDDSILSLRATSGIPLSEETLRSFNDAWVRLGHRPKLFHRKAGEVAEFCGCKILVDGDGRGLSSTWTPDVLRGITNAAYSYNSAAVEAAVNGDRLWLARAVAPGLVARAHGMSRLFPSVARALMKAADAMSPGLDYEYSVSDRVMLDAEFGDALPHIWEADRKDIETNIVPLTYEDMKTRTERSINESVVIHGDFEADNAVLLGVVRTKDDWLPFLDCMDWWASGADEACWKSMIEDHIAVE